jgi:hypothetical protein
MLFSNRGEPAAFIETPPPEPPLMLLYSIALPETKASPVVRSITPPPPFPPEHPLRSLLRMMLPSIPGDPPTAVTPTPLQEILSSMMLLRRTASVFEKYTPPPSNGSKPPRIENPSTIGLPQESHPRLLQHRWLPG